MFYDLLSEHLAGQVAHDLMHADHDAALSVPSEGARFDARINGRPLALPVLVAIEKSICARSCPRVE
jgi:hypothetical protein